MDGPVFEPLHDPAYFAKASLDPVAGTVVWPNEADFAPEALYELEEEKEPMRVGPHQPASAAFVQ
jgi:hypothetical protein